MARPLRAVAVAAATVTAAALAAAALAAAAPAAVSARPAAPAGCGTGAYSYAGLVGPTVASGVSARVSTARAPSVVDGQVTAWVGVGGQGLGPRSTNEWLQVGISAVDGLGPALYYEVALPNTAPRHVTLTSPVPVGKTFDVAVLEARNHPGSWQVWVNGKAVTKRIVLPGSHGAWPARVTAENWNSAIAGTCNGYAFRFSQMRVATKPGGAWQPLTNLGLVSAPAYQRQPNAVSAP
jgi:hypothetical protein